MEKSNVQILLLVITSGLITLLSPLVSLCISVALLVYFESLRLKVFFGCIFSLSIGLILYHFYPIGDLDMARYYYFVNHLANVDTLTAIKKIFEYEDIVSYGMMYVTSITFGNHFIPLLASVVTYGILFYVIAGMAKRLKTTKARLNMIIIIFLICFQMVMTITGVRFGMAMSVFIFAMYLEGNVKSKRFSLLVYFLSMLTHSSMAMFATIKLVTPLASKMGVRGLILMSCVTPVAMILALNVITSNDFLQDLNFIRKVTDYFSTMSINTTYYYWFNYCTCLFFLGILIWHRLRNKTQPNAMVDFTIAVLVMGLLVFMYPVISGRFLVFGKYLFVLCLFYTLEHIATLTLDVKLKRAVMLAGLAVLAGNMFFQIYSFRPLPIEWSRAIMFHPYLDRDRLLTEERPWI